MNKDSMDGSQLNGILVLNKPRGLSSAQCTGRIKRLGQKKIGHAGTLDPMATGVLIVLLGQATKLSGYLLEGGEKRYEGILRLGISTDTWDVEGKIVRECTLDSDPAELERLARDDIENWTSLTEQEVPPYSAAKHDGQPLYKLARTGKDIPVKMKKINVTQAEVQSVNLPDVRFRVSCSSGSYIRSLAHSLGMRLGWGATLTELTRVYSHPYSLNLAHSLEDVLARPEELPSKTLPLSSALPNWPVYTADDKSEENLRNGKAIPHEHGEFQASQRALFLNKEGYSLALVEAGIQQGRQVWAVLRGLSTP